MKGFGARASGFGKGPPGMTEDGDSEALAKSSSLGRIEENVGTSMSVTMETQANDQTLTTSDES